MSRKGAKSHTQGRKLRSTRTKAGKRVGGSGEPRAELEKKLVEALDQQAATSKVLEVISSSSGDLQAVFEAILANAVRLCDAKFGALPLCQGDAFRMGALHNAPSAFADFARRV